MNKIITITYNRPQIKELATCIANQTLLPDEWVVINNNGQDPTSYIQEAADKFPVKVIQCRDTNSYPQACGWRAALDCFDNLDKICTFDDDDYMPPKYFEERMRDLQKTDITYCDVRRYVSISQLAVREFKIGSHQWGTTGNTAFTRCKDNFTAAVLECYRQHIPNIDTKFTNKFCPLKCLRYTYSTIPVYCVKWNLGNKGDCRQHFRNDYVKDPETLKLWFGQDLDRYLKYSANNN